MNKNKQIKNKVSELQRSVHIVNEKGFFKDPIRVSNILTSVLIIVTISSVIATCGIISLTRSLENTRQKELIVSKVQFVDKLILELKENEGKLEHLNKSLDEFRDNNANPIDTISIVMLENSFDFIDDKELVQDIFAYLTGFRLLKKDIEYLPVGDMIVKNDTITKTRDNLNGLLAGAKNYDGHVIYGISKLIEKLESYKSKLENQSL